MAENQKIEDELDKFGAELKSHGFEQPEFGELYKRLYDKLYPRRLHILYETIENNPNGLGESAIMRLANQWGLTPDEWDAAYSKMDPYLKNLKQTSYYKNRFGSQRNYQPGKPFIDINAKTVNGEDVKKKER